MPWIPWILRMRLDSNHLWPSRIDLPLVLSPQCLGPGREECVARSEVYDRVLSIIREPSVSQGSQRPGANRGQAKRASQHSQTSPPRPMAHLRP